MSRYYGLRYTLAIICRMYSPVMPRDIKAALPLRNVTQLTTRCPGNNCELRSLRGWSDGYRALQIKEACFEPKSCGWRPRLIASFHRSVSRRMFDLAMCGGASFKWLSSSHVGMLRRPEALRPGKRKDIHADG